MTTTNALTLYDLENELAFLMDTVEAMDAADPLRPELELQIAHAIELELRKVDGVCRVLAHFESQAALAAAEIKRLQMRKARFENAVERLENHVRMAMETAGKTKIEGETATLHLQANPASVIILDAEAVPVAYKTLVPESWTVSKAAIAKALKAGIEVPGADLSEGNMRVVRS